MQNEAKPVAWMYTKGSECVILSPVKGVPNRGNEIFTAQDGWTETPLYAHPPAPAQPADVERVARAIAAAWDKQMLEEAEQSNGRIEYEPGDWQEWEPEARAALAAMPVVGGKRSKPWCDTCGCDVQEVLCPKCAKWWNDNPPADANAGLVERIEALEAENGRLRDTFCYLCKWVERGLFDGQIAATEALNVIAYHPGMPWKKGRWDVDHKPYAEDFYRTFPNARQALGEGKP